MAVFERRHPQNAGFNCKTKATKQKEKKYLDLPILRGGEGLPFQSKSTAGRSASHYQMTSGASVRSRAPAAVARVCWEGQAGKTTQHAGAAKSIHAEALQADP